MIRQAGGVLQTSRDKDSSVMTARDSCVCATTIEKNNGRAEIVSLLFRSQKLSPAEDFRGGREVDG
jgi:hypothetical protein